MPSRDDESREPAPSPARWPPAAGASGSGSAWDRRAQGRTGPGQEPARWQQERPDSPHRGGPPSWGRPAGDPWERPGSLGSTHAAGWGSQPGAGLGSGYNPEPQSAVYGSGHWSQASPTEVSGTGYGQAGPGQSGYGPGPSGRPSAFLHDHDYRQWREEQLRRLDADYLSWRQERYRQFADDFNAWRSRREAGAIATASQEAPAAAQTDHATTPGHDPPDASATDPTSPLPPNPSNQELP